MGKPSNRSGIWGGYGDVHTDMVEDKPVAASQWLLKRR
jgi:hypothetical protein